MVSPPAKDIPARLPVPLSLWAMCLVTPAWLMSALLGPELFGSTTLAWLGACAWSIPALWTRRGSGRLRMVASSLALGVAISSAGIAWHQHRQPRYEGDDTMQIVHAGFPVQGIVRLWSDPRIRNEAGDVIGFAWRDPSLVMRWDLSLLCMVVNLVVCTAVAFAVQRLLVDHLRRSVQVLGAVGSLPAHLSAWVFLAGTWPHQMP